MDGIPALDLWNLVQEVFHCDRNQANKAKAQEDLLHRVTSNTQEKSQTKAPTKHHNSELFHLDSVPSNVRFFISCDVVRV